MELYLVRHGQTDGTTNPADPPLTASGREQAAALGEALAPVRFDLIVSSHLIRAVETAAAIAIRQQNAPPVLIDPLFAECGTPKDFRQSPAHVRAMLPYARFGSFPPAPFPDEQARINACLERLRALAYETTDGPENLLIAAHGTFNAMLIYGLLGAKPQKNVILSQGNACLNRISFFTENGTPRIRLVSLNDLQHLPPAQRT